MRDLPRLQLAAYGLFGLPLAMAALPLYVHLPKFYADLGLSLGVIAAILFTTRLVDAVCDPLIGHWSDTGAQRPRFVAASIPLLALGMVALFQPPASSEWLAPWLALTVILTYLGFSLGSIAYQAWGAALVTDPHERTRVTAAREIFALGGVVLGAALPQALGGENPTGLGRFALGFAILVVVCGAITLFTAPRPRHVAAAGGRLLDTFRYPIANRGFRRLVAVFAFSGIAASIPSTLVLFFVGDVLQAEASAGLFLVLYFLAAAAGMPLWVALSRRIGKRRAWIAGMALAIVSFVWAYGIGAGDVYAFGAICVISGIALGSDLALPASILADVIDDDPRSGMASVEGSYFGFWNLVAKANLAIAAGIALPTLSLLGYAPGTAENTHALSIAYALLPCAFKLAALAVLAFAPPVRQSPEETSLA